MTPADLYTDGVRKLYGGCGYSGQDCGEASKADVPTTELASDILVLGRRGC